MKDLSAQEGRESLKRPSCQSSALVGGPSGGAKEPQPGSVLGPPGTRNHSTCGIISFKLTAKHHTRPSACLPRMVGHTGGAALEVLRQENPEQVAGIGGWGWGDALCPGRWQAVSSQGHPLAGQPWWLNQQIPASWALFPGSQMPLLWGDTAQVCSGAAGWLPLQGPRGLPLTLSASGRPSSHPPECQS